MKKSALPSLGLIALTISCLLPVGLAESAFADSPAPAPQSPSSTPPQASPSPLHSADKKHGITEPQKQALAAAKAAYQSAVQEALNGATKAIADARSIRDQALAAAGKDANVRKLANSDFMNSSTQIWGAFKSSVAAAKSAYDQALASLKSKP